MRHPKLPLVPIGLATLLLLSAALACGDDQGAPVDAGMDGGDAEVPFPETPFEAVDCFVGTGGLGAGVGSTYPGAARPFSLVKLSPDTSTRNGGMVQFQHYAGYYYGDPMIVGFSHTHLSGIGVPGYGNVRLMPTTGWSADKAGSLEARQEYDKATETAVPGYYAVTLEDGIRAELTVGERTGYHRYTFPAQTAAGDAVVTLDFAATLVMGKPLGGLVVIDATESCVHGWSHIDDQQGGEFLIWVDAQFDRPILDFGVWADGAVTDDASVTGTAVGAWVALDLDSAAGVVNARVGLSWVDAAGARQNRLDDESRAPGFDDARSGARVAWEEALGRIAVEGGTALEQRIFYSSLYRSYLHPTRFSDADGRYAGFDGQIQAGVRPFYTDMSLWDTYRTTHPLFTLLEPEASADMAESLVQMAEQWGGLPRWPMANGETGSMIGSPASIVIAGAYRKGITDFSVATAWEHMLAQATGPVPQGSRSGLEEYLDLGYVASDLTSGSVSRTQEYNWADFAIANLAEALGHTAEAATLREQSRSCAALWDDSVGYFRGRNADGSWDPAFSEEHWEDYFVEGNARQHLWLTPYPDLLASVMGGREGALARLDDFFAASKEDWESSDTGYWGPQPYYWHGNEPDLHAPYLYAALGRPTGTQRWARWIMEEHYRLGPAGLAGNDDVGTLAAWYVWSALGIYPWAGSDLYVIGTPAFARAVLHLDAGDLIIEALGLDEGHFVQSVTLDGAPVTQPWLRHAELAGGGTLSFVLGAEPSGWGETDDYPL